MKLKLLKIPLVFLFIGIFWTLYADPLITDFTKGATENRVRQVTLLCDFIFVVGITMALYVGIKRQYDKLTISEAQYRQLFESNPNPMWISDANTLKFVKVNEATVALYGYSKSEFLSMSLTDIRTISEQQKLLDYKKTHARGVRRAGNWKHLKKGGEPIVVSIVAYDLRFNGALCTLVMATNITEMLLKEDKIIAQNAALQGIAWSNSHVVRRSVCSIISLLALLKDAKNERESTECVSFLELCAAELDQAIKKTTKQVDELGASNTWKS